MKKRILLCIIFAVIGLSVVLFLPMKSGTSAGNILTTNGAQETLAEETDGFAILLSHTVDLLNGHKTGIVLVFSALLALRLLFNILSRKSYEIGSFCFFVSVVLYFGITGHVVWTLSDTVEASIVGMGILFSVLIIYCTIFFSGWIYDYPEEKAESEGDSGIVYYILGGISLAGSIAFLILNILFDISYLWIGFIICFIGALASFGFGGYTSTSYGASNYYEPSISDESECTVKVKIFPLVLSTLIGIPLMFTTSIGIFSLIYLL